MTPKKTDFQKIRESAEECMRNGDFACSETVMKVIRDEFAPHISDDVIAMASGFPGGIGGSGCTCGAVSGAVMALGMFFGRKKPKDPQAETIQKLSKELHDWFTKEHKQVCCRFLTRGMEHGSEEHMRHCETLTGKVAEETARIIAREMKIL